MNSSPEIKLRKPNPFKLFGKIIFLTKYACENENWRNDLPNNGDKIEITWLPDNRGEKNAYIGFIGTVENMNKEEGTFCLNSGSAILICHGTLNYIKLN